MYHSDCRDLSTGYCCGLYFIYVSFWWSWFKYRVLLWFKYRVLLWVVFYLCIILVVVI